MDWDLAPGDRIRRVEVHHRYGGGGQSGVSPSRRSPNVLIFSDPEVGALHGYNDHWSADNTIYHYAGAGQTGDQTLTGGNGAILRASEDGRALRVFWGVRGVVEYAGEFDLDPELPYEIVQAHESRGTRLRNVIMFRLLPIGETEVPNPDRPARRIVLERPSPTLETPYREADESVATAAAVPFATDPNEIDRALRAHRTSQNELARFVSAAGFRILSPGPSDPDFDLAWDDDGTVVVVEVKSVTRKNERGQLRLGLGQVLDYQHTLREARRKSRAVLCLNQPPSDPAYWLDLCRTVDVTLTWPGSFDVAISVGTVPDAV